MIDKFPIGSLVRYRLIRCWYGIVTGYNSHPIDGPSYKTYKMYWLGPRAQEAERESFFGELARENAELFVSRR